jgi:hypothetical protein
MGVLLATAALWAAGAAGMAELAQEAVLPDATGAPPAVIEAVPPEYPWLPLQARVSAVVQVDVEVPSSGVPASAKPRVTSAAFEKLAPMFEGAAKAAALRWRFAELSPDDGRLRHATVTFTFKAKANDNPIENYQQQAQLKTVFKAPLEMEITAAPYVCYLPAVKKRK